MRRRESPDVDITPLLDMMFMLIIFFVITTSFTRGEISVDLPDGEGVKMEGEVAVLNISSQGGLLFQGLPVKSGDLPTLAKKAEAAGQKFVIAGDRDVNYGVVAEVLDILRRDGVSTATLAIEGK